MHAGFADGSHALRGNPARDARRPRLRPHTGAWGDQSLSGRGASPVAFPRRAWERSLPQRLKPSHSAWASATSRVPS
ncbi:hypothetical protein E5198_20100 [Pseudomonas sp. A-1]|nr:hypothetical protein E5198_20100 [Pseudomonas sp. A-1]